MSIPTNFRQHEWWKPKAGILLSLLFFSAALWQSGIAGFLELFFLSLVTLTAIGSFGHILNDTGDIDTDALAGKPNTMAGIPPAKRFVLMALVLAAAIAPWFFLAANNFSYLLLAAELLLLIIYPLKPFRLKRFPHLAVVADGLYAYAVPAVLAFHTYCLALLKHELPYAYAALFVWMMMVGLRQIIYHQVADKDYDRKSGIANLNNFYTIHQLNNFIRRFILPVELISGVGFFAVMLHLAYSPWLIGGCALLFIALKLPAISFKNQVLFPHHFIGSQISDRYYIYVWASVSLAFLTWKLPVLLLPAAIVIFVFGNFKNHFYFQFFREKTEFLFNSVIYYFRKLVLRWDEKKNLGEHYSAYEKIIDYGKNGTIAIFNENFDKYTETFVKGHRNLHFGIQYYYGKHFPIIHHIDGHLLGKHPLLAQLKYAYYHLLQISELQINLEKLAAHLTIQEVKLILCEFGTTGARVAQLPVMTGIPLICVFYGYDAWNKQVVQSNIGAYKNLFSNASAIIGVSRDICAQLKSLGCAEEKIHYLPCYVNLNLFQYSDHSKNPPVFLSVGRFSETKSPHLTILAFNEVLKEIPEAKLIMIGKDGGGELFEACNMLAKALGIEGHIEFAGIQSPEKVYEYMKTARVFVQHSITTPLHGDKEGTPVSVMEAMACGLPVVATRHAGIAEQITHGENGILVEEYDYCLMAVEMVRVCNSDELVFEMGESAAEGLRKNELIANNIDKLSEIIVSHKLK